MRHILKKQIEENTFHFLLLLFIHYSVREAGTSKLERACWDLQSISQEFCTLVYYQCPVLMSNIAFPLQKAFPKNNFVSCHIVNNNKGL